MTPLLDTFVETVEGEYNKSKETKDAYLVVTMTDGEENSSHLHNATCASNLVSKLKEKGNWNFVYLGANQDSWATASLMGFAQGNVANWQSTDLGASRTFKGLSMMTANFSAQASLGNLSQSNLGKYFDQEPNIQSPKIENLEAAKHDHS